MNPASAMSWSATMLAFGLGLAWKATVILAVTLVVQMLIARRALLASAIGNAALLALVILPMAAAWAPALPLTCLPAGEAVRVGETSLSRSSAPMLDRFREFDEVRAGFMNVSSRSDSRVPVVKASATAAPAAPPAVFEAAPSPVRVSSSGARAARIIDWAALAVMAYATVAVLLLARFLGSLRAVERLRDSCQPVDDQRWYGTVERWRAQLAIRRPVALASSARVSVPVVLGWLRPTIVVPGTLTEAIPDGQASAVVLHELCHVRRNDYFWNLMLCFVQALYWPHALVWLLGRTVGAMRERACDDLCVHAMGGPSGYRETLLAVASGMIRRPGPALGLAMARTSRLGRRLAQIDRSHGNSRCVLQRASRIAIGTLAILVAGVIGALQIVRAEARVITVLEPGQAAGSADGPRVLHLRLVAADTGQPVPNAVVRVVTALGSNWRAADAQGRIDVPYATGPADRNVSVAVWGKDRAMQRHIWGSDPKKPIPDMETIRLQPGETLGGIVQDEPGRPIAGATVYLYSHNYKRKDLHELLYDLRAVTGADGRWQTSGAPETTGELLGVRIIHPDYLSSRRYQEKAAIPRIADLRAGKAVMVMKKGVPIEGRVIDADGKPVAGARVLSTDYPQSVYSQLDEFTVLTDDRGRFRTGQVNPGEWHLIAQARGHSPGAAVIKLGSAIPQVEIKLGRPHVFKGRVVDPQGKPIAEADVSLYSWREYRGSVLSSWTDADGRFRWDEAPGEDITLSVNKQGFRSVEKQFAPSTEDVVFTLEPVLWIQGKLTDAETGKRVENATVEYSAVHPTSGEPIKWSDLPTTGFAIGVYRGVLEASFPVVDNEYKIRVRSPGYRTFISRTFRREEKVVTGYDIALRPGTDVPVGTVATVLRPEGKPLGNARVVELQHYGSVSIEDGIPNVGQGRYCREGRTTPDGQFGIPQSDKPWVVFILGDDCFAVVSEHDLGRSTTIHAKPRAAIEGQYLVGSRPVPKRELNLHGMIGDSRSGTSISLEQKTTTDAEGRFTFRNVIPATGMHIAPKDPENLARGIWTLGEPVRVEPGKTTRFTLGGKGRPVIGRIEPPEGWTEPIDFSDRSEARIDTSQPHTPYPLRLFRGKTMKDASEWVEWGKRWYQTPESRDYDDRRVSVGVPLAPDGSFRLDDVVPGDYRLTIRVNGEAIIHAALQGRRAPAGPFARIVRGFTVPPIPGGRSDEPLDLGVLRLQPRVTLKVGEPAPRFEVTTLEGKKLAVPGDFRGKVLLINFGTFWDPLAANTTAYLNETNQKSGQERGFAMLGLLCEPDTAGIRRSIADLAEPWPQAFVGPLSNPIASAYGIDNENASACVLIGPDGKILAGELFREKIEPAIRQALRQNEK